MNRFSLQLITVSLLLSGCAHSVHQVQVSDFKPSSAEASGKAIRAQKEQFVIMGFTQDTSYVNKAYRELADNCPNGTVSGITAQLSTSLGFFSWTNKILLQGLCSQSMASNDVPKKAPQTIKKKRSAASVDEESESITN